MDKKTWKEFTKQKADEIRERAKTTSDIDEIFDVPHYREKFEKFLVDNLGDINTWSDFIAGILEDSDSLEEAIIGIFQGVQNFSKD